MGLFLVVGMDQVGLADHLDLQRRIPMDQRRWAFAKIDDDHRVLHCPTDPLLQAAKEAFDDRKTAEVDVAELPLLVPSADAIEAFDGTAVAASALTVTEVLAIDKALAAARLAEVKHLLDNASSAASACHFLELRDRLCESVLDPYPEYDWRLEKTRWWLPVDLGWTDALACHRDGNLIFNIEGEWTWSGLEEAWLDCCGASSNSELNPEQRIALESWLTAVELHRGLFACSR